MILRRLHFLRWTLLLAFAAITSGCSENMPAGPVILAASSTQEAMEEAADVWAAKGNVRPVLSFAGTPALARQIKNGVPADVFISADKNWLDALQADQLIREKSVRVIAGNALVAINPASVIPYASGYANVTGGRMALADPETVPAGRYAKAALIAFGGWDDVQRDLVPTENVRASLALVERGEVSAAVVYQSDAAASDKVFVVHRFRTDSYPEITYLAAVVAQSRHPDAEKFVDFLATPEATAIFVRHGFLPPPDRVR